MTEGRGIWVEKAEDDEEDEDEEGTEEEDSERFSGASWDSREEYLGGDPLGSLMDPAGGRTGV